ncbi:GNAT family N-acetyltransferase [Chrysiogenes arsenatis]|uniref:GNAT family N-acetyltransferase n=1 Tax=Chrysiogenes arsenatis TaxID=309797 RepID=UPI00042146C3|nr:GNAT family N-acyltransferase [Chrysiogenes arsenatis]
MLAQKVLDSPRLAPLCRVTRTDKFLGTLLHAKIRRFMAHVPFSFETSKYSVKTADSGEELERVLRLRYDVFYTEVQKRQKALPLDMDRFDTQCDHLMIIDKRTHELAGTYRMNASLFNSTFYSSSEFDIRPILALPGKKLELGRACVSLQHRNSSTIALLWKGINEYLKLTESRYLFGCSSVQTTAVDDAAALYLHLLAKYGSEKSLRTKTRRAYRISGLEGYADFVEVLQPDFPRSAEKILPPLLKFYLKAGAVVCGGPALDLDFGCVDFLTLLDMQAIDEKVSQKFSK